MKWTNPTSITISLALHALLIVFLVLHIHHDTRFIIPGKKQIILASLVMPAPKPQPRKPIHHKTPPVAKHGSLPKAVSHHPQISHPIPPKPKTLTKQPHHAAPPPHQAETKAISGTTLNKLIAMVYRDIAAHKTYPEMAQQLNQTGVATVSFMLHPDGKITALTLVRSSGYEDLDQAALEAVTAAQPFLGMHAYLHQPRQFQLKIHFQN